MRVVLDTNVVASALLWGGVPRLLLHAGREKRVDLFTSAALLAELTDILGLALRGATIHLSRRRFQALGRAIKELRDQHRVSPIV